MNLRSSPAKPTGSRERSLDEVKAEFMRRGEQSVRGHSVQDGERVTQPSPDNAGGKRDLAWFDSQIAALMK